MSLLRVFVQRNASYTVLLYGDGGVGCVFVWFFYVLLFLLLVCVLGVGVFGLYFVTFNTLNEQSRP